MESYRLTTLIQVALLTTLMGSYLYEGILDPTHTEWLLNEGDLLQHFLGWHFFRHEAWGWPLGALHTFGSEVRTSIVFTDSLPLLALPLKLIEGWLPDPFQYQGLAALAHVVLNGIAACLLLTRIQTPMIVTIAMSLVIAVMPAAIFRGPGGAGHETLMAHWILLLAIYLVLFRPVPNVKACVHWALLLTISVLVHFYLFLLAGLCWALWWLLVTLKRCCITSLAAAPRWWCGWLLYTLFQPLSVLVVMWAVGYLHTSEGSPGSDGFGFYLSELLSFFNGYSYLAEIDRSSFLWFAWHPSIAGQYEGMSYVGLGVIALWGTALVLFLRQPLCITGYYRFRAGALVLVAGVLFIFALSDTLVLGRLAFELPVPWPESLRGLLRASGRMVWVLMYLAIFAAIHVLVSRLKKRALILTASVVLAVQAIDLSRWHHYFHVQSEQAASYHLEEDPRFNGWSSPRLTAALAKHQSLELTYASDIVAMLPLAWLAGKYHMSINVAYVARITEQTISAAVAPTRQALLSGHPSSNVVYAMIDSDMIERACALPDMQCITTALATFAWQSTDKEAQ
ncbi:MULTISPECIES: DUF6311 domain-containing protein [unclassified Halomonas]|uniref:DUF6311 domain-containing protein n=1 Tax=unclassified Halomonas TaxID=2609666 RepID=UPI00207692F9|nr:MULTISPECIES: DUF6311 domain-containing protein [unclassified Halomonas]